MSEVELCVRLTLADVNEPKFDVGNLLLRGLSSSDPDFDLIDIDPHNSPARTDKACEVE